MTDLFKQAIAHARTLSPEMQDEIARVVMAYAGRDAEVYRLTPEEIAELDEADAEIARGDFATDADVRETFAKFKL